MIKYQSKRTISDPVFIKDKEDLKKINILGHGDKYININTPDKFSELAKGPGLVPYVNSHDLPIYLFIGAVVFGGMGHYEVMKESEFNKHYEKIT